MTEDDEILHALGEDLRDRDDRLSRGEAPEALAQLLSNDERSSVLDAAFARLDAGDDANEDEPEGPDTEKADDAPSDNVVPLANAERRGRGTAIAVTIAVIAAAAMVLLWLGMPRSPDRDPGLIASIPTYSVTNLSAGQATDRADASPTDRIELRPNGKLDVTLTPKTPFRGALGVAIVARRDGGSAVFARLSEGVQISDNGGIRLRGPLDRFVVLTPGEWTLELLIGPPEALPQSLPELPTSPDDAAWRTLSLHATVTSPSD